jgi:hypothetical protein
LFHIARDNFHMIDSFKHLFSPSLMMDNVRGRRTGFPKTKNRLSSLWRTPHPVKLKWNDRSQEPAAVAYPPLAGRLWRPRESESRITA